MTRTIAVIGGKGGIGKTTLTSNLAYALTNLGEEVIAIDANMTTPNLGLHFGIPLSKKTLHDVLKGKTKLNRVIHPHPYGFKFIPSSISTDALKGVDAAKLENVTFNLTGRADYILLDCAAGLGREATSAIAAADEILVVTNPDMPSIADALKTADLARRMDKDVIGVVVNRHKGKRHEMNIGDIKELMELPVIAQIPEDVTVGESIAARQPIIDYAPESPAAVEIYRLAHKLVGRIFVYEAPRQGMFERVMSWMGR